MAEYVAKLSEEVLLKMGEEEIRMAEMRDEIRHSPLQDPHEQREVGRLLDELNDDISRLSENVQTLIERTSKVAAMDRPIPDESQPGEDKEPQTEYGAKLLVLIQQVRLISDVVSEHCYRMEV